MAKKMYVNLDFQNATKAVNMADPSSAQDGATKNYVDNALLGIGTPIGVKARTTGNITISTALNSGDTIDGVTLANGDLVLVDQQTTATEDGVYVVAASPSRYTGLATGEDARGLLVVVEAGTANGGKLFMQTANPAVIGTDGLTFTAITAGITYTADGNGIELSSTTFSLELDGTTLSKSSSGLRIGSGAAGNGLTESSGVLAVNTGTGVEISSDAVRLATQGTGIAGGGGSTLSRDHSLVADWKSALGPASAGTTITYAHGLGQRPSSWKVTIESSGEDITSGVDVAVDATNVTVTFGASQSDRSLYRVSAVG